LVMPTVMMKGCGNVVLTVCDFVNMYICA
jgi:hypothetical protein